MAMYWGVVLCIFAATLGATSLRCSKRLAAIVFNLPGCCNPGRHARGREPRLPEAIGFNRIYSRALRGTKPRRKPSTRQPKPQP